MGNGRWGHCRSCRFFGSPAQVPLGGEEARCKHPELSRFELKTFGASGCNGWALRPGMAERTEGQPGIVG